MSGARIKGGARWCGGLTRGVRAWGWLAPSVARRLEQTCGLCACLRSPEGTALRASSIPWSLLETRRLDSSSGAPIADAKIDVCPARASEIPETCSCAGAFQNVAARCTLTANQGTGKESVVQECSRDSRPLPHIRASTYLANHDSVRSKKYGYSSVWYPVGEDDWMHNYSGRRKP